MKRGSKTFHLLPERLIFPSTYINSVSKNTFQIFNDDSEHLRYEWRRFSSEIEENSFLSNIDRYSPEGRNISLLFNSTFFKIYPINGELWGNSSTQSIVEFTPTSPKTESAVAYLLNLDTGERKPFSFQGQGLPPSASFNVQQINVGHVALEGIYEYQINLINSGLIPLDFHLIERSLTFPIINFSPTTGKLDAGEKMPINIYFQANHVGQFNETFKFKISELDDELCPTITIFGRIIGPTFNISKYSLDFGTVSYGFLYSEDIEIENTSEIPFDYRFQLSNDTTFSQREFNIVPESGTIPKYSKITVKVEFIPTSIQNYSVSLNFGSDKFSEQLMSIPISARCICPEVEIIDKKMNLGQLFLRYKYIFNATLKNNSNYPAKFEFIECNDESNLDANFEPLKFVGEIEPKSEGEFPFAITPLHLGHMDFTRYIRIAGSDDPPMRFDVTCLCIGPIIEILTEKVEFGKINILTETDACFPIKNDSHICGEFRAEIESKTDAFSLKINSGIIEPCHTLNFCVTAFLDDSIDFYGKLTFYFKNLAPMEIPLHARGKGSGLISSIKMDEIDMNYSFTGIPVYKRFKISNVTRRVHEMKWMQIRPNVISKSESPSTFQFRIDPESCVIQPKQSIDAYFVFNSKTPCSYSIQPVCEATVGKKKYELFKTKIQGEFIKPSVVFKCTSHSYSYVHDTKEEEKLTGNLDSRETISPSKELLKPITYSNSIKNVSLLPLSVKATVNKPFYIDPIDFYLEPNELKSFDVTFDPSFKKDFTSQKIDDKIDFTFSDDNPQHYFIDLHADLIFPNLSLSPNRICFGNLLKSTEDNSAIHIQNISSVPVSYFWELLPKKKGIDIAKLFDIYPIRGEVEVGESEDIHISFFALDLDDESVFEGFAVCHVIGGPDYTVDLMGSSASVEYQLGPRTIDFGTHYFADSLQSKVMLTNASEIPLQYEVKLPKNLSMSFVSVEPTKGSLEVGRTQVFNLSIVPGFPTNLKDSFLIQIDRVVDEEINFSVNAVFPQIETNFNRDEDDEPTKKISEYRSQFDAQDENEINVFKMAENQILLERMKEISNLPSFKNQLKKMTMMNFSKIKKFNGFILSRFVVDFGPIILGDNRVLTYNIKSISPYPISFELFTKNLDGTGFSIEQTSFENIPPDADLEIDIRFDEEQRTLESIGPEVHEVPIIFSEDLASMLTIKSIITIPDLEFSIDHVDFETTLVGQKRTITLNLINNNLIPLEYKIENAIKQNSSTKNDKQVFFASPNSGTLPPISYQNIGITFAPIKNEEYSMSFPIIIQHNNQIKYFNLTGKGVELKLKLDPSVYDFHPLQPFDDPITFDAEISNPNDFPIEVFLPQWDLEIENEILNRKFKESQKEIEEQSPSSSPLSSQEIEQTSAVFPIDNIKKFSICVIVNGPSKSGKTTVSKCISKLMGDLPIVDLKEVWKELIENDVNEPEEYVFAFSKFISKDEFIKGFIIDGLNAFKDAPEIDSLIISQMKQKSVAESLNKNPFTETQGDFKVSFEKALNHILAGLNGQYVFQIALQTTPESIEKHQQFILSEEEKKKENKIQEEIEKLLNMDEDDYLRLSEEEQRNIDQKRIEYRKKILQDQGIDLTALLESLNENESFLHNTNNIKNAKRSRLASTRRMSVMKSTESVKSNKAGPNRRGQNNQKNNQLLDPSNLEKLSVLVFTYSLGRIVKQISTECVNFEAIDPVIIANKQCESVIRQHCNTLLIDTQKEIELINQQIKEFLPTIDEIKDKVLPKFIPEPTLYIPKYCSQEGVLEHLPSIKQFKIVNKEKPGEFPVFERIQSPPKGRNNNSRNTGSRNSSLSRRKTMKVVIDRTLTQNLDEMNYTKRYNLDPGQSEKITIMYSSNEIGFFDESIPFSIDNIKPNSFDLRLKAQCLYPDVDKSPESVFQKVVNRLTNRTEYSFVSELNEFHFGALLVAKERTKNQPFQYRQSMKFFNPSPFETQVNAFLANLSMTASSSSSALNIASHSWRIEDSPAIIQPGETKEIFVCFHPSSADIYKATVKLFIKDNPEPFSFNFAAEACLPSIELSTMTLDFDKLLLKQVKKLVLELKNPNRIPAIWKINKPNQFNGVFSFNCIEGVVQPRGTNNIEVTYTSSKPQVVKKQIQIDVLDSTKQKVYQSNKVQLNAESFDVNFDFFYPKGFDHLMIGTIKANQERTVVCTLKNKGKYPSNFSFSFAKQIYSNSITIEPISGTILPTDKPINVTFTFCTKRVFHLNRETVCYLTVSDSSSDTDIAKIDVQMTVDSFYSQYEIEPKEPIQFEPIQTGKTLKKEFTIINTGCFPFEFELIPKIDVSEPSNSDDGHHKKGRRYAARPAQTGTRSKKGKISVGCFNLSHGEGTIQPGGKEVIVVDISSNVSKHANNIVFLKITDVPAKDPAFKGIEINLKGDVYNPGIEINNFSKIFPKQNLRLRFDLSKSETTAFLEDEQTFHFKPEMIGEKKSINIDLFNINPIPCIVDLSVKPGLARRRTNASFPFKLSNDVVEIPPLSTETVQLFFFPSIVGSYSGTFKAEVKGGTDQNSKMLKFDVEGVAALPLINILNCELKPHAPIKMMSATSSKTKLPLNTNSGVRDSKTKLNKIPLNTNSGVRDSKTKLSLNISSEIRDSKLKMSLNNNSGVRDSKLKLTTGNGGKISLPRTPSISNLNAKQGKNANMKSTKFTPIKNNDPTGSPLMTKIAQKSASEANINQPIKEALISFGKTLINTNKIKHVSIQNSGVIPAKISILEKKTKEFSIENIDVSKEFEIQPDRIFDVVILFSPKEAATFDYQLLVQVIDNPASNIILHFSGEGSNEDVIFEGIPGDDNHIQIKDTCVKRQQTASFTMRNVSEFDFRFAWIENKDFHFSPRIGHLRKKKAKQIKVTFYSEKPIRYDFLKVNCQLSKIELADEDAPDWDDSMTIVKYVERSTLLFQQRFDVNLPNDEKSKSGRKTTSFKKSALKRAPSVRRTKLKRTDSNSTSNNSNSSSANTNSSTNISPRNTQQLLSLQLQQQNQNQVVKEVGGDLVKVIEVKNEPLYSQLPVKCPDVSLTISAVCDFIRYEIDEKSVTFAPTMMFETRVAEISIKNISNIRFEYGWRTVHFTSHQGNYSNSHKCPFSVLPKTGFIESGQSTTFKICFTPEEVDDFSATLQCEIPFLSVMEPPRVEVSGFSRRPLCHFNITLSDYLSSGRRHPDYNYPLPDEVRVVEIFSSGVGKKTFKKFEIINTTSHPYEIVWEQSKEHFSEAIVCENSKAFISSGTGYSISFSYLPKSVKTVEAFWTCSIPEHQIQIPFLFVGKIMHK